MELNGPRIVAKPPSASLRIAIVGDEVAFVEHLAALLTHWGHEVICATDATSAYARLPDFRPHLVLLDFGLSVTDRAALAEELRHCLGFEDVCLAALTGFDDDASRKKALASKMDVYLVKPVKAEALSALLASVAVATRIRSGA